MLLIAGPALPAAPEPASTIVDQVEVVGQRTLLSLRAETELLERDMFELFNTLNSNDDFDVACGHKTPTGSKIPVWQCEAAFMRNAESDEFARMWDNRNRSARGQMQLGYVAQTPEQLAFRLRAKTERLNDEMKALALDHPELREAMVTLQARREQLDAMERELAPNQEP